MQSTGVRPVGILLERVTAQADHLDHNGMPVGPLAGEFSGTRFGMTLICHDLETQDCSVRRKVCGEERLVSVEHPVCSPSSIHKRALFRTQKLGTLLFGASFGPKLDMSIETNHNKLVRC